MVIILSESFSWIATDKESKLSVGSTSTATELVNKKQKLELISSGVGFDEII